MLHVTCVSGCGLTSSPPTQCHLYRGIHPLYYDKPVNREDWAEDMQARFLFGVQWGKSKGFIQHGSTVILLSGWKPGPAHTNTIRIFTVD